MTADRFCSRCGTELAGGMCPSCPPLPAPAVPGAAYAGQWNWGAFLLCPFWLMNHGRVGRGIIYLLVGIIPFAQLVMSIVYGVKGNEVASTSRAFVDDAQFVAVQNAWRNWGFGVLAVYVLLALIGVAIEMIGYRPTGTV